MNVCTNIVLIGKYGNYDLSNIVETIAVHLTSLGCVITLDQETFNITHLNYKIASPLEKKDLAIVIGGDGSMLGATRIWSEGHTPLIGINYGRVGFLTDLYKENVLEQLTQIIKGHYKKEVRSSLYACAYLGDKKIYEGIAINEIAIGCANVKKLIEVSVFIDEVFVYDQYADRMIVATPTGSSAYALMAGGSLISPNAPVFNIVLVCPQSLSNRPLIISDNSKIKILENTNEDIDISADGTQSSILPKGSYIIIEKHMNPIIFYHPEDYNYFEVLRNKLNWGK